MERKTVSVDGKSYVINPYMASKGIRLLARLTKTLGLPLAHLLGGGGKADAGVVLPLAIQALTDRMEEEAVLQLIKDVLSSTLYENIPVSDVFDEHFQGGYGRLFKLLGEVVRYQYEDFLSVAVAVGLKELNREKASQSQKS